MALIRESIVIAAPVERIWRTVHVDLANVPRWAQNLLNCEVIGGGTMKLGSKLRYEVRLPAGKAVAVDLLVEEYERLRRCSGTAKQGGMRGTWAWSYEDQKSSTVVTYESELRASGLLKLTLPLLDRQVATATKRNLEGLKKYAEGAPDA